MSMLCLWQNNGQKLAENFLSLGLIFDRETQAFGGSVSLLGQDFLSSFSVLEGGTIGGHSGGLGRVIAGLESSIE